MTAHLHHTHCREMLREIEDAAPVTSDARYDVFVAAANYAAIEREAVEAVTPRRSVFGDWLFGCAMDCTEGGA